MSVTIAVPTFHRPAELGALLPLLLAHADEAGDGFPTSVLIVDNDPGGSGKAVVDAFGDPRVRAVVEAHPGISAVRNRALAEAGTRLLAFIDDDEVPHDGWLTRLLDTWLSTDRPAAVSGRVVAAFSGQLDPWLAAGSFFVRRRMPTGSAIDVAAAGNLLLDLDQVRAAGVRFADDLGLSGGEDTLFSRQLHALGYRMTWCDESAITDMVPPERMTRRWVLQRAWSHGNSASTIRIRLARTRGRAALARVEGVAGGAARVVGGALRWLLGTLTRSLRHQARGARAIWRGGGMVTGALGVVYQEYARDGDGAGVAEASA
ncbi:glycosyltransferase family 2 protein [Leifsonia virtsii]|uniref:Glycosyltransferase family A protein n=1 Tax=Leifsonia virtsii TaxID=3035915 RepID=A0ABT8IWP9_9MICO|nr:glycosyltransferase family A protein [Leifsonia virtsii]MDN4597103.1 glycosyltransferase family A protein [Leifsonia virtsii]